MLCIIFLVLYHATISCFLMIVSQAYWYKQPNKTVISVYFIENMTICMLVSICTRIVQIESLGACCCSMLRLLSSWYRCRHGFTMAVQSRDAKLASIFYCLWNKQVYLFLLVEFFLVIYTVMQTYIWKQS